mmetsp:Transcript_229/g.372  ORF Transcript_229/g.372 Transcript_229/m.372 type:complete len:324 (+) Transcript_229:132-1103(+)
MDTSSEMSVLIQIGTTGAVATCALLTPLDVVRHSAQAAIAKGSPVPGPLEALRAARQPGMRGLWRALPLSLGLAAFSPAIFLVTYELQKGSREALQAGLYARAAQISVLQPLEFLRTCRQATALVSTSEREYLMRGPWQVAMAEGVSSLWRGIIPTLLRDVPAVGIFWTSYSALQSSMLQSDQDVPPGGALQLSAASAACAALSAGLTQPFDVVKTRMQVARQTKSDHNGYRKVTIARVVPTLREVYKMAGVGGFWAGGVARAARAAIGGFLLGPIFEFGQLLSDDATRPVRKAFVVPDDPSRTIVHPRSYRALNVEVAEKRW